MINVAVIGCGYWGPNLIRNFSNNKNCSVVYCCDLNEDRLQHIKTLYPDIKLTKDYTDIINDPKVDAVAIATPVSTHFNIASDCLKNDKHVLVEKPLTSNSQDAGALIKLSEEQGKILMVDQTFEYSSAVNKVKEIIDNGELGKIFTFDMIRVNLGLFQKDINVVWDLAPHDLSILNYLIGDVPESIVSVGESFVLENIEDDVRATLRYKNKVMANIHISWLSPEKIRKLTIVGNKKMLVFDDTLPKEKIKIYDKGVTIQKDNLPKDKYYDTFDEFQLVYRSGEEITVPEIEDVEPLKDMCNHFLECIDKNKTPKTDGNSGLKVIKIIETINKSLKQKGKEVKFE